MIIILILKIVRWILVNKDASGNVSEEAYQKLDLEKGKISREFTNLKFNILSSKISDKSKLDIITYYNNTFVSKDMNLPSFGSIEARFLDVARDNIDRDKYIGSNFKKKEYIDKFEEGINKKAFLNEPLFPAMLTMLSLLLMIIFLDKKSSFLDKLERDNAPRRKKKLELKR